MCDHPSEYHWTSHHCYVDFKRDLHPLNKFVLPSLELFATGRDAVSSAGYEQHLAYRMSCDVVELGSKDFFDLDLPDTREGDQYFAENFAIAYDEKIASQLRRDLRDIALEAIRAEFPDLTHAALYGKRVPRKLLRIRDDIIRVAAEQGHPGVSIAAFFGISAPRVSTIVRSVAKAAGAEIRRPTENAK